jgi:hypothetical protein
MLAFYLSVGNRASLGEWQMCDAALPRMPAEGWRSSRWLTLVELAVVAIIYLIDWFHWHHLIFFSKTPYLFLFAWLSLRVRRMRWRNIGLHLYRSWGRTLALGILVGALMEALELLVTQPLLVRWLHHILTCLTSPI